MLNGLHIVCLSSLFWDGRPSTWYHLARVLSRTNRVLFVDPPRNLLRGAQNHAGRLQRDDEGITVFEPPPHLPYGGGLRMRVTGPLNQRRYATAVARAVEQLGWTRPVLWNSMPIYFSVGVTRLLDPAVSFLHVTDDIW